MTAWQQGEPLDKISELELLEKLFFSRFVGVLQLMCQIKALHDEKIIHADLKPNNVVMDKKAA